MAADNAGPSDGDGLIVRTVLGDIPAAEFGVTMCQAYRS